VCFEKKQVRYPTEIICLASSFITYRAGLQKEEAKLNLEMGAKALKERRYTITTKQRIVQSKQTLVQGQCSSARGKSRRLMKKLDEKKHLGLSSIASAFFGCLLCFCFISISLEKFCNVG
jgi:hypothetical protein